MILLFLGFGLSLDYPQCEFVETDVFERGLVDKNLNASSVVQGHNLAFVNVTMRRYNSRCRESLAFVTPWNNEGYNISVMFGDKFTTVVPTWFQSALDDGGSYVIKGHDVINTVWLAEMRERHPNTKILPRLLFEVPAPMFERDLAKIGRQLKTDLIALAKEYGFDGFFLEFPSYLVRPSLIEATAHLVKDLRSSIPSSIKLFGDIQSDDKFHYNRMGAHGAIFRLLKTLNYAFISVYELGMVNSVSTIRAIESLRTWTDQMGLTKKVIVGLPLFGFDFISSRPRHIYGLEFVDMMNRSHIISEWDVIDMEHKAKFTDARGHHIVCYPTLKFLYERYEKIVSDGFGGFGLWELAQGLPYFFDLL